MSSISDHADHSRPTREPEETLAASSSLVSPSSWRMAARRATRLSSVTLWILVAMGRV